MLAFLSAIFLQDPYKLFRRYLQDLCRLFAGFVFRITAAFVDSDATEEEKKEATARYLPTG